MKCYVTAIAVVAAMFTQLPNFASGSQRICMQLENVDSAVTSSETRRFKHGAPGKKGIKGDVGEQGVDGPAGPPGRVDYARINDRLETTCDAKIENLRAEIEGKLKNMESWIFSANGVCDVYYLNVCYWLEIHSSKDVKFADAQLICGQRQSTVADVIHRTQYELIVEKIRSRIPSSLSFVEIWTALKINPADGVVTLSSGVGSSYLNWNSGQPDRHAEETRIRLMVQKNTASSNQGMLDIHPTYNNHGVICQYKIQ